MKTTLFNLHELKVKQGSVIVEFYAGDIFDIQSDVLLLSAFKGGFNPVEGTTWGSLKERTGISVKKDEVHESRISKNMIKFHIPQNDHFSELAALEMCELPKPHGFTSATMKTRYSELADYFENHTSEEAESLSLPLLGTGNQGLSLEESVSELLKTFSLLKRTKLKIIRVFARDFESIGVLNKKINELLSRTEVVHTTLLNAAMDEARKMIRGEISPLSFETITDLISLADSNHSSLYPFGIKGRIFAERVCDEFLRLYGVELEPSTLHSKISGLSSFLRNERPYVESHLRLLQTYGNQVAHGIGNDLNDQDAASIILSMIRIINFYEFKCAATMVQP